MNVQVGKTTAPTGAQLRDRVNGEQVKARQKAKGRKDVVGAWPKEMPTRLPFDVALYFP